MSIANFQKVSHGCAPSFFEAHELEAIIQHYSLKVSAGEWRDYTIFMRDNFTSFVVLELQNNGQQSDIRSITAKNSNGQKQFTVDDGGHIFNTNEFDKAIIKFSDGITAVRCLQLSIVK